MDAKIMPRFYFHLQRGAESLQDEDGTELPHWEAAYLHAFESARELWSILLEERQDPTVLTLLVMDEDRQLLFTLPLVEVLEAAGRRREKPTLEAKAEASALLSKNRELRAYIVVQTQAVQEQLSHTLDLLSRLRDRGEPT
jgi:Domain of unknown function (DUF6894)